MSSRVPSAAGADGPPGHGEDLATQSRGSRLVQVGSGQQRDGAAELWAVDNHQGEPGRVRRNRPKVDN